MAPVWERARRALATRLCMRFPHPARHVAVEVAPRGLDDDDSESEVLPVPEAEEGEEVEMEKSPADDVAAAPASPRPVSRSSSRNSAKVCAICLGAMRSGQGQALFTAECSHKFHFNCISSNVQHGNKVCPVCRALWKELPFQGPPMADAGFGAAARVNPSDHSGFLSRAHPINLRDELPVFLPSEPPTFDDDEQINLQPEAALGGGGGHEGDRAPAPLEITAYTELPAIQESVAHENFAVLIRLKAPRAPAAASIRAPVDLVTVLDVSGSMGGTKLALLKRAMSFVIQNLGPSDRLSVVSFSSSAVRLFPLRRMTPSGQQQSLQALGALAASGGTSIAAGLLKATRVMEERRARNPVCSIILLSDGVDNCTVAPARGGAPPDYAPLVPPSILPGGGGHVPVHAFGLGADADSRAMHAVAEMSGGTFSSIHSVRSIQDAFAQCIGGLLSVVAQEVLLRVACADGGVALAAVRSGAYASGVNADGRGGFVDVGRLYADEERGFLLTLRVPAAAATTTTTTLARASCTYRDAVTGEAVRVDGGPVAVARPAGPVGEPAMSAEVEREWQRVWATEDMAAAQAAAERGDFARAASILESRRRAVAADPGAQALAAELREMQGRVLNQQRYDESGRSFILAGLSSHSWQRATARGDSTELAHAYQTPSMVDMLHRSQALLPGVVEEMNRSPPAVAQSRSPVAPTSAPLRRGFRAFRPTRPFTGWSSRR